jgi:cell division ATPase FtsA
MVAEKENISVVGVDIGGATTDIFLYSKSNLTVR